MFASSSALHAFSGPEESHEDLALELTNPVQHFSCCCNTYNASWVFQASRVLLEYRLAVLGVLLYHVLD
ncbi:hypothetical protein HBI24_147540 [Parastagonospora nodorum]|nr:hypothetical protein HBI09_088760 [Parastagonospora nodorum]KAH4213553.1 hypothetical protein HBI95_029300 [Parastagonospora nodorum]KAH4231114.1 hypothetical protein HBI05_185460 [Parastagonospora nodorum]KAH4261586.1 hypothetical protein HBI03_113770 [Parastagonospora nodorum]KAH4517141.1 hypothetical protein HBH87_120640 [Parastagonospora nodorum]